VDETRANGQHPTMSPLSSRKLRVAVAALAIAMLAAACSSSKDKSGGGGSSKGDIVVGGVQDGTATGIDVGFKARIARFNAAGGIDGRKIKLLDVLNDGGSLSGNLSAIQTLVLKDKVFAVTPISSRNFSPRRPSCSTSATSLHRLGSYPGDVRR